MSQGLSGATDHQAQGTAKGIIEGSNLLLGRTSNVVRILSAHMPYLARWILGLVAAVRQPSAGALSDVRLRNLATIKTSIVNACMINRLSDTFCTELETVDYNRQQGSAIKDVGVEDIEAYAWRFSELREVERRQDASVAAE